MNKEYFKNNILPHFLSITGFILILALYFSPLFFQGKHLLQNDVLQGLASGQESVEYRAETGEEALWTNSMFGGMPLYLINMGFSGEWLNKIFYLPSKVLPVPSDTVFLSFICFYIFLSVCKIRPWIAFLGAFAYAFGTFNIVSVEAGHIFKVRAISFMPLVFSGILLVFQRKYILGTGLTALAIAMELGSQHYQITYYLFLLVALFMLNELIFAIKGKTQVLFFKATMLLLIAAILGVGTSFGRIWGLVEYGQYSIRGKSELSVEKSAHASEGLDRDYAFAWSQGVAETLTLLVPNLVGGASGTELGHKSETYQVLKKQGVPYASIKQFTENAPTYWGGQPFTAGPIYAGIVILFLFIVGMFLLDGKQKYWVLVAVILSCMLAWGKNFETFNYLMFDYFPGYNKFRTVSMAFTIALFGFPYIASLTLEKIIAEKSAIILPYLWKSLAILGGGVVLIILFAGMPDYDSPVDQNLRSQGLDWLVDSLKADRKSMLVQDGFRSLFFLLAVVSILFAYIKDKVTSLVAIVGITILGVWDLVAIDKRYLNDSKFTSESVKNYFEPSAIDKFILQDKDPNYRVFNLQNPFNEARTSYFHKSIGGYHGAKLRRYQDLIERQLSKNNLDVLNMLNTRYIITGNTKQPVQKNPEAYGNAWFVNKVLPVNNPDQEIDSLGQINPKEVAVIDQSKFKLSSYNFDTGESSILLKEYKPNNLKYIVDAASPVFAVFSEIYYEPGWEVYLDGKPSTYVRVNYVLRGMEIPAGKHDIEFKFAPKPYFVGNKVMWTSSILISLMVLGGIVISVIQKPKE